MKGCTYGNVGPVKRSNFSFPYFGTPTTASTAIGVDETLETCNDDVAGPADLYRLDSLVSDQNIQSRSTDPRQSDSIRNTNGHRIAESARHNSSFQADTRRKMS